MKSYSKSWHSRFFFNSLAIWTKAVSPAMVSAAFVACNAGSGDSAVVQSSGERLVDTNACGSCHTGSHGTLAGGDVPKGGAYPPNLTPDMETGLGGWTAGAIMTAISEGNDDQGMKLCSSMPRFHAFSTQDLADLATYLRGLPVVKYKVPDGVCADP